MNLEEEVARLTDALQVCEMVLGRKYPTGKQLHAARQAATAYRAAWNTEDVWDDLPDFLYASAPDYTVRARGHEGSPRFHCHACGQYPQLKVDGTFRHHTVAELSTRRRRGPVCTGTGKAPLV